MFLDSIVVHDSAFFLLLFSGSNECGRENTTRRLLFKIFAQTQIDVVKKKKSKPFRGTSAEDYDLLLNILYGNLQTILRIMRK